MTFGQSSRRDFFKGCATLGAWATASQVLNAFGQMNESFPLKRRLVWVSINGGWDLLETVDPKPASTPDTDVMSDWGAAHPLAGANAPTKLGRWLPRLAALGEDMIALRGLAMGTTSHDAGRTYMDTAILSNSGRVNGASIPAIVASESGATIPLIQLSGGTPPSTDRGLLKPLTVVRAENLSLYKSMFPSNEKEGEVRLKMLDLLANSLAKWETQVGVSDRLTSLKASEIKIRAQIQNNIGSQMQLSDGDKAPFINTLAASNLTNRNVDSVALALKLLNNNLVSCVTLGFGGFDTHANQSRSLEPILKNFDAQLSVFIQGLKATGNLDNTLIVVHSDFGRTPKVNSSNGRDHWPVGGALLIGGGLAGGRAVGATDDSLRALSVDPLSGSLDTAGVQLNPTHLAGAVIELTLGTNYLIKRPYTTSLPCLTRLRGA